MAANPISAPIHPILRREFRRRNRRKQGDLSRFEYEMYVTDDRLDQLIFDHAQEGWRVHTVFPWMNEMFILFERPITK